MFLIYNMSLSIRLPVFIFFVCASYSIYAIFLAKYLTSQVVRTMEEFLEDYNQITTAQMRLVLFMDAVTHVSRIARVIRQPLGNALLLGMGGSGRQSLTRLAAHM